MDSKTIEAWASEEPARAKELGKRLILFAKDREGLKAQPSLGDFEDRATEWAIAHPTQAKLLILKLFKRFAKAG